MTFSLNRRQGVAAALASLALCRVTPVNAQHPDKPLRVILPVGAGSGVDTIIRAAAPVTRSASSWVIASHAAR